MTTAITEGIKISVQSSFRNDLSHVEEGSFFFDYRISIENRNSFEVQLLHRDWIILDSLDEIKYVSGEGVVGQQPILQPGEVYSYMSGCELSSEIGFMKGYYTFKQIGTNNTFQVFIPQFELYFPPRLN
jgi:ApaG protein